MKRLFALLLMCVLLVSSAAAVSSYAASSDFDIRDGVLYKYSGSGTAVTVPDGVTSVAASAFINNTAITSVTIPSTVYDIGEQAFYGCTSLKSVSGGSNVSLVGDMAFYNTPYLDRSTDKYLMLGNVLLWYNGTSDSVSIPTRCTAVASYAFLKCEYLKSFTAYDGLLSIGTGAFYGCTGLTEVNLPSTVTTIGAYAFDGSPYLRNLGEFAVAGDGVLMRYQGTDSEVTVPENVRRIASRAFTSSKLISVTLPESVYALDTYAFADCVGLRQINFTEGLVMVGDSAFRGCKSITKLETPQTLSYIGQSAFEGDAAIEGAALKGKGLTLSDHAFKGCTALRYVLMSDGVSTLYDRAFDGCTSLEGISLSQHTQDLSTTALNGCDKVTVCCEDTAKAKSVFSAYPVKTTVGDSDGDRQLNILDATMIQCYMARIVDLKGSEIASSDVNFDAEINILDPLTVQMWLAGLN